MNQEKTTNESKDKVLLNFILNPNDYEKFANLENSQIQQKIAETAELFKSEFRRSSIEGPCGQHCQDWFDSRKESNLNNIDRWRTKYPEKLAKLICGLYLNPFLMKFSKDIHIEEELKTIEEKVSFIAHVFEKSYEYFSLISISNISVENSETIPDFSFDLVQVKKKVKHPWDYRGFKFGYKCWAIAQSGLFKDPKKACEILKEVRNGYSHDQAHFTADKKKLMIFSKEGKLKLELSVSQINDLYQETLAALQCAKEFNVEVVFKKNFWIDAYFYGVINWSSMKEYFINVAQLNSTDKEATKSKLNLSEFYNEMLPIILFFIDWLCRDLWLKIKDSKNSIDKILSSQQLELADSDLMEIIEKIGDGNNLGLGMMYDFLPHDFRESLLAVEEGKRNKDTFKKLAAEYGQDTQYSIIIGTFFHLSMAFIWPLKLLLQDLPKKIKAKQ